MEGTIDQTLAGALAAYARGDLRRAARELGEAFVDFRDAGNDEGVARSLALIGLVALDGGDAETAARSTAEALAVVDPERDEVALATACLVAARLATREGDHETALRLLGAADAQITASGEHVPATSSGEDAQVIASEEVLDGARGAIDRETIGACRGQGRSLAPGDAAVLARARTGG